MDLPTSGVPSRTTSLPASQPVGHRPAGGRFPPVGGRRRRADVGLRRVVHQRAARRAAGVSRPVLGPRAVLTRCEYRPGHAGRSPRSGREAVRDDRSPAHPCSYFRAVQNGSRFRRPSAIFAGFLARSAGERRAVRPPMMVASSSGPLRGYPFHGAFRHGWQSDSGDSSGFFEAGGVRAAGPGAPPPPPRGPAGLSLQNPVGNKPYCHSDTRETHRERGTPYGAPLAWAPPPADLGTLLATLKLVVKCQGLEATTKVAIVWQPCHLGWQPWTQSGVSR